MLRLVNITKKYKIDKNEFEALKNVNLFFSNHGLVSILGQSGCGKTTLLNIIGGLDKYTSGDLIIENKSTKLYKDKEWDNYRNKRVGFIFQSYNLIPHLSILANVEMALVLSGVKKKERNKIAKDALDKVGLQGLYNKKQNQLSGGQTQRVAIARALVNNPEIILADEPTGALDSSTSVMVMNILKEISKTKLVIMVTHNEELANEYSDRIIKIKDGSIIEDSSKEDFLNETQYKETLHLIDEKNSEVAKENKLSRMKFTTALGISIKNLVTKKGRTILTSVASSFGIIGVALVLALSNGFQNYVARMEKETASSSPITYSSFSVEYDYSKTIDYNETVKFPEDDEIYPYLSIDTTSTIHYNNFSNKFLNYLDYLKEEKNLISSYLVNYHRDLPYNLYTKTPNSLNGNKDDSLITWVDAGRSASQIGSMVSSVTGLPNSIFHELYGDEKYTSETYELISGSFPKNKEELVLIVDNYNRVSFDTLKALGFYHPNDIEEDVKNKIKEDKKVKPITFDDILNKEYKIYTFDEIYTNPTEKIVIDGEGNERNIKTFDQLVINENTYNDDSRGLTLKITGILRAKPTSSVSLLTSSIGYTKELSEYLINENAIGEFKDVVTDNIVLKSVDQNGDKIGIDNFINDIKELVSNENETISSEKLSNIYKNYFIFKNYNKNNKNDLNLNTLLNLSNVLGVDLIPLKLKEYNINEIILSLLTSAVANIKGKNVDEAYFDLIGLYAFINTYSTIQSIIVFPKDISSKPELLTLLDEFNKVNIKDPNDPYHASNTSQVVNYSDVVGDLTKGLGQMINIITIVLTIFASISLVVSCVMTGIITYTSVIERTKEIGVLRALGARKNDVGKLFEAETVIIGALAGIIGCLFAFFVSFPINGILNIYYGSYNIGNICSLNIIHAIILVLISILLTFISSLIPARVAAKKDPVIALRTE